MRTGRARPSIRESGETPGAASDGSRRGAGEGGRRPPQRRLSLAARPGLRCAGGTGEARAARPRAAQSSAALSRIRSRAPGCPRVPSAPRPPAALHTSRPARLPLAETIPVGAADWCLSPQLVCMRPCGAPGGGAAEKLTRSRRKCPAERLARSPPRARSGASRAARSAAAPPSAAAGRSGTEDGRAQPARGMEVAGSRRSRRAEGAPARYAAARPAAPGR